MSGHQPVGDNAPARTLQVHPVADMFPMLPTDDLNELAADIKQRGLIQPIVLDGPLSDERVLLLDGRNRLAACGLAGVEPTYATYDGTDPIGYILALNINRRHMTKGQQAMVAAKARSLSKQDMRSLGEQTGVSAARIAQAATVLDHAPDLADAVVAGATGLNDAYQVARERKTAADSQENQLARLRTEDPELADKVVEGDLSLRGAFAELAERQKKKAAEQRDARALLARIVDLAAPVSMADSFVESWAERLGDLDTDLTKRAEMAGRVLLNLAERKRR